MLGAVLVEGPRALVFVILATLLVLGCAGEPDPRLETPQQTVETLLRAYDLWGDSHASAGFGERLGRAQPDIPTVASCFWDYDRDDPGSRAMGEFVAGVLSAGQRGILYDIRQRTAVARSRHRDVVFVRSGSGWQIVLRDSVPEEIRRGLGKRRPPPLRDPDEIL